MENPPPAHLSCQQSTPVDLSKQGEVTRLSFTEHGCAAETVFGDTMMDNHLYDWRYRDGLLELHFRFNCNCCSAFRDSVNIQGSIIDITLSDTSSAHCYCTCPFQDSFTFTVDNTDRVQVILYLKAYPDYHLKKLVDTELEL